MTTNRLNKFFALKDHAWFGRYFSKLSNQDLILVQDFLSSTKDLGRDDLELAINRLFLDKSVKPKNWKLILELLSCSNSIKD